MESSKAQVLSKKQCRKTLSARNVQPKITIKNVLQSPYSKYWPIVDDENENAIKDKLEMLLPAVARKKVHLKYSDIKELSKEKRRNMRQEVLTTLPVPSKDITSSIAIGINAVTRHMERSTAKCVLLSKKVDPVILTNHISLLSVKNSVPLLVMNSLEDITTNILGFKAIALAFIKQDNNHFDQLTDLILNISQKYPFPELHILEKKQSNQITNSENLNSENVKKPDIVRENFYLKKPSDNTRAFIPMKSKNEGSQVKTWSDFISLKNTDVAESTMSFVTFKKGIKTEYGTSKLKANKNEYKKVNYQKKNGNQSNINNKKENHKVKYESLKIKRMQGNMNRPKNINKKKFKVKFT